jgi:NADPH:quinone reductase
MNSESHSAGLQLRSLVTEAGMLELSLVEVATPVPGPDEVVIRIEAAPINPSDLGLLLAGANLDAATVSGSGADAVVSAPLSPAGLRAATARLGESMGVGNEGGGVVVAAGSSDAAQALLGRTVGVLGGPTYSQFRTMRAASCLALPDGVTPAEGAACFVNPLTALGMVETMKAEGHRALIHTAAASNLGQMLNRICLADDIGLVNIVRRPEQAQLLRDAGAVHVIDSSAETYRNDLIAAITATGATIAFDATGGGRLASQILDAMEASLSAGASFSRYGSSTHKQVYLYGGLDTSPTELIRTYGMAWSVGGWLLTPFLIKSDPALVQSLRARVAAEITTTFASSYTGNVTLAELLDLDVLRACARMATGEKLLITPAG